jgi:hypothetical protein
LVRVFDNRLGHTSGERLAQRPDRLADLRDGRFSLGQLSLEFIKPSVKTIMELLAQHLSLLTCTDVV